MNSLIKNLFVIPIVLMALIPSSHAARNKQEVSRVRPFELWYKENRMTQSTELPTLYYSILRGGSLKPSIYEVRKNVILPTDFKAIKPGERYDKSTFFKDSPFPNTLLIISEKEHPEKNDLVYLFVLILDQETPVSLLLRFRPANRNEHAPHRFGPIQNKWFIFGPQTGPSGLRKTGKTESGKPLEHNITDNDILSGKIAWESLIQMSYDDLLSYLHSTKQRKAATS